MTSHTAKSSLTPEQLQARGWTMPGSIRKRGKSYALRLYIGKHNGIAKYKWLTYKTRVEAQAAQHELASHTLAHAAGLSLFGSPRERLGPYLVDWVERQAGRLAPKTLWWYRIMAAQCRADVLGTVPLGRLTPRVFESYYARKLGTGLSPTTVLQHHRLLHTALRAAARQDIIVKNPVELAQPPRRARARLLVWSESETALFLSEARQSSAYYRLYLFLAATGCRLGESLGLLWRDVDLRTGDAAIRQALQRPQGGGPSLREPKTPQSHRTVTLPVEVVHELQALRAAHDHEARTRPRCDAGLQCRAARCPRWHVTGLVFTQPNGKPLHDHNIRTYNVIPLCRRLGLPYRRALHNLRHGHATMLLHRGVSLRVVSERLGHGAAAFTLQTYSHVLAGMQAGAAAATSAWLRSCASPAPPEGALDPAEPLENIGRHGHNP